MSVLIFEANHWKTKASKRFELDRSSLNRL
jgi:hypothetical protein